MLHKQSLRKYETAALQDPTELDEFCNFVRAEHVSSYLEIGAKHGGSLWAIGRMLPKGARIVAVDLPHGDASFKESEPHLIECGEALAALGYQVKILIGDSTDPLTVEQVRKLGPFDLCLIDANHTSQFVWMDWNNYGPMAKIVAFHDIGWQARPMKPGKMPIHVPEVWAKIKQNHRVREIRHCPRDNGIGILWNR
jgi:cephalosporin hydroxylase